MHCQHRLKDSFVLWKIWLVKLLTIRTRFTVLASMIISFIRSVEVNELLGHVSVGRHLVTI